MSSAAVERLSWMVNELDRVRRLDLGESAHASVTWPTVEAETSDTAETSCRGLGTGGGEAAAAAAAASRLLRCFDLS